MSKDLSRRSSAAQVAQAIAAERETLSPGCRADPRRLEQFLAPDFHEFGASGEEFEHAGTAAHVAAATTATGERIIAHRMRGWLLTDGLVMVKYVCENGGRWTNRTSLWRRVAPGLWQIFHHQGTITDPRRARES